MIRGPWSVRAPVLLVCIMVVAAVALAPHARASSLTLGDEAWTEITALPGVTTFPDTNTRVFQSIYLAGPGVELVLRGEPPAARYWSFAILDLLNGEIANLSDRDIELGESGTYEVVVRAHCSAEITNCIDTAPEGAAGLPGRLLYRVYVPDGGDTGGVDLPSLSVEVPLGELDLTSPIPAGTWSGLVLPLESALRPGGLVHETTAQPFGLHQPVPDGQTGPAPTVERFGAGAGFGSTTDNAYVTIPFHSSHGDLVLRARAPSYRSQHPEPSNTLGRADGTELVRYWSLCTTQITRPVDCVRDENVVVAGDGFFEVIVAPECPVAGYANCLRAGPTTALVDGTVIYRNLLAADSFANSLGPAQCPPAPSQFCEDYAVHAQYVSRS